MMMQFHLRTSPMVVTKALLIKAEGICIYPLLKHPYKHGRTFWGLKYPWSSPLHLVFLLFMYPQSGWFFDWEATPSLRWSKPQFQKSESATTIIKKTIWCHYILSSRITRSGCWVFYRAGYWDKNKGMHVRDLKGKEEDFVYNFLV